MRCPVGRLTVPTGYDPKSDSEAITFQTMSYYISGIQQIGIGNPDVQATFKWYNRHFGMDIKIFEEAAEAGLMLPYTGGEPRSRHAILAINMQGGGGLEIWQYTSREPQPAAFDPQLGDTGIFIAKYKCRDVVRLHTEFKTKNLQPAPVFKRKDGVDHFYVKDLHGNWCEVVGSNNWFTKGNHFSGGVYGATIGVTDMDKAMSFYSDILGYDRVIYDETGNFDDLAGLPSGDKKYRRVLLTHSSPRVGAFSRLLGTSEIELFQALDREPRAIFKDRMWGDLGYIHLCFDIRNMDALRQHCEEWGAPFTIDSANSFDMGEAAGHFSYIEDPDGTLIEFVETHKVPVLKKINWYMNLKNRDPEKPLPNWMVKALGFNRVKV